MQTMNAPAVVAAALMALTASAVEFTVDFTKETGKIRRINGISNCAPLSGSKGGSYTGLLKPLEAPRTHLHDDALLKPYEGWYALASKETDGKGHVLVSAFKSYGGPTIAVKGEQKPVRVRLIDNARRLDEVQGWTWDAEKRTLAIPRIMCESAVWLVDFE